MPAAGAVGSARPDGSDATVPRTRAAEARSGATVTSAPERTPMSTGRGDATATPVFRSGEAGAAFGAAMRDAAGLPAGAATAPDTPASTPPTPATLDPCRRGGCDEDALGRLRRDPPFAVGAQREQARRIGGGDVEQHDEPPGRVGLRRGDRLAVEAEHHVRAGGALPRHQRATGRVDAHHVEGGWRRAGDRAGRGRSGPRSGYVNAGYDGRNGPGRDRGPRPGPGITRYRRRVGGRGHRRGGDARDRRGRPTRRRRDPWPAGPLGRLGRARRRHRCAHHRRCPDHL